MSDAYKLGRSFEYSVKRQLEKRGYFVLRSAGSHSPIDLLAMQKDMPPLFVQAKREAARLGPTEWRELIECAEQAGAWPVLAARTSPRKTGFWKIEARKAGTRRLGAMIPFDPGALALIDAVNEVG